MVGNRMNSFFLAPEVTDQPNPDGIEKYREFTEELLLAENAARREAATAAEALRQAKCDLEALGTLLVTMSVEMRQTKLERDTFERERDVLQRRVETLTDGLAAISRFAVWLSARHTLLGLLCRPRAQATLALKSAMHGYRVPRRVANMDWLQNKRVQLGLLWRRLLGGNDTAQSMVFTQMARELLQTR
jgi:hypothetical protein